jgi:hypothetical protein
VRSWDRRAPRDKPETDGDRCDDKHDRCRCAERRDIDGRDTDETHGQESVGEDTDDCADADAQ